MVQPGYGGGLDTPQTNIGDATYLSRQPDFDISQEASFQSPSKDANLLQQMRNGGHANLRTPRGRRAPFGDRRNLPAGLGGAEFTPLLKSATRNSARRHGPGKENGLATPAFLGRIDEDMTPVPAGESSVYGASRNASYSESTPLPMADTSSVASTPMIMRRRGADGKGPLEDGNQLSLREQENVIDRIEKENFGLKLKIHFLEDALRKAGPGFSEAALRENTELKVDKVTMQRELQRYKKHLTSAEKELETYRLQILEVQEKAQKRFADENQRAELERLRQELEEKDADIEQLRRSIEREQNDHDNAEKLQDDIADLEADVREKDRVIGEHEDQLDELRLKLEEAEDENKDRQRRILELEQNAQQSGELDDAKDTIEDLEAMVRKLEQHVDELKEKLQDANSEKDRAQGDLDELQEEMSNKSMVTKGLSRQVEEKISRLQHDLEKSREDYSALEKDQEASHKVTDDLKVQMKELRQERDSSDRVRQSLATKLEELQGNLNARSDENALLQTRHDALASESASMQREVGSLQHDIKDLEDRLERERQHALDIERDVRNQYKDEVDRLNDEISDLQAEVRERDNLYDNDSEKWETEQRNLESERNRAEERADGLQKTIDKLREVEGSLSSKETRLQEAMQSESERHKKEEAILQQQIEELQQNLGSRQDMLEQLRSELSASSDELSRSQRDYKSQAEKVEALEDEVEILQATIDEESEKANREIERAKRENGSLEEELNILREDGRASTAAKNTNDNASFVRSQLVGATGNLTRATKEKQALQDQLANINIELHSLRTSLAEVTAERDDLHSELQRARTQDADPFRVDQERIELRTAKTRLDGEIRRLKEDNKNLTEQRLAIEKTLDDEIEKAATEEERLSQEILQLQTRIRQSSDNQGLTSARRTVRELERRIEDLQNQLAASHIPGAGNSGEGNSELSLIRRDLTAARAKELDMLQREASQKDVVKSLKRQVSELERRAHDAEISRLMFSPPSAGGSAQMSEVSELRNQLSSAYQTVNELKKSLREADRKASGLSHEMEARIEEVEEQRTAMEQALEDAQLAADEAAATYDLTLKKYKHKLEKYKRERAELASALREQQNEQHTNHSGGSEMSLEERRDLHAMLRESQTAADQLDREVREQREALEELIANDANMRKKLERARSERAAYRASAEKLQRDVKTLKTAKQAAETAAAVAADAEWEVVHAPRSRQQRHGGGGADTDAIIRAAEAADQRHAKEIRGMCMQLEWMQARWERESQLRADAAYAKRYLLLELQVRDTCNKADLVILNDIMGQLKGKARPALTGALSRVAANGAGQGESINKKTKTSASRPTLKRLGMAVRFVVRMQIAARGWSQHEKTRRRLAEAAGEMQRQARMSKMRDEWRAQMHGVVEAEGGAA